MSGRTGWDLNRTVNELFKQHEFPCGLKNVSDDLAAHKDKEVSNFVSSWGNG